MREKDRVTNKYINKPHVFADAFNMFLYKGKQVIEASRLKEYDSKGIVLPYGNDGVTVPVERIRDSVKILSTKTDGNTAYCICGIENQSEIHYAMPVRNGLYDFITYAGQVEKCADIYKKSKVTDNAVEVSKMKGNSSGKISNAEFLSGFHKNDRLLPVITLVIYFGSDKWDAPLTLKEMYSTTDDTVLKYVPDYKINLIVPHDLSDEEIDGFHSGLREIIKYIKHSGNKNALDKMLENDKRFTHVEKDVVDVIKAITGTEIEYDEEEETVNMCIAEMELMEDARMDGMMKERSKAINRMLGVGIEKSLILSMGYTENDIILATQSDNAGN